MKKKQSSLTKEYPYLLIFLDDLKEIEELYKTHCSGNFCIRANEYEYESIEELSNHLKQGRIKSIELSAHEPYVSLDIDRHSNRLYSSADNDSATAAFHNINDVLMKCKPRLSWLYSDIFFWLAIIPVCSFTFFMDKLSEKFNFIIFGFSMFVVYCAAKNLYLIYNGYSKILLIEKHKQKNFFQRNKDQLLLILITSILSILVTLLVQKYLLK